ncbi:hypothetical protein [Tomitella fengzijianii]|uniref:Uncharacterized protein n=1 Tax=Tomitella fengzijianii TaxID=2597660 RepID=A0A516X6J9_9ACTN|nr:hypothetical protein [Tomitella fengzijianii]QDQ98686.1 hypothetical protein FO059_16830 [Tomitella fengzijianii]
MEEYFWVMKEQELDLMREIEPARLAELDEDALLEVHRRVRRARNKHVKNYRRAARENVSEMGGRGAAAPKGAKKRLRAEAFEEALALVSERVAVVAHEAAEKLKAERLARAQENRGSGPDAQAAAGGKVADTGRARKHAGTTGGVKRDASSRSQGAQRQAKRDSR